MSHSGRTALVLLCVGLGLLLCLRYLVPYIGPFYMAILLVALVDGPVNHLEAHGVPRGLAVLGVLVIIALLTTGMVFLVIVHLAQDLWRLADQLPTIGYRLQELTTQAITWLSRVSADLPQPLADELRGAAGQITLGLEMAVRSFLSLLASVPRFLASLAIAVLAAFFLARDGRKLAQSLLENVPDTWRTRAARLNREIFLGMVGLVQAQVILMSLSCVLSTVVLLAFRIPYAWLLGLLAGMFDILPIVGLSGVFIPLIVWQWISGHTAMAGGLSAAWGVIVLIRQACEPSLVSSQLGLHPLTSLAAMYIGVQSWGVAGAILGPLVAISAKVLWLGALKPILIG